MPRIAYIAGQYPLVSLTFIQREIAALRELGLDVITCSMRRTASDQHPGAAEMEAAQTTFHVIEKMKHPLHLLAAQRRLVTRPGRYFRALRLAWATRAPGAKAALYQLIYFLEATVLARHLEDNGVTHMHNHFTTGSATVSMLTSELTGISYSFTLHGPADFLEPYRWRLDEKTARARFVATISHYARAQLMFFSDPTHWDRLHIIHCGVTPEIYSGDAPVREQGALRLIFVGRIVPVKGLPLLIEAVARLADDIPGLELVVVGDGPDRARIEAAAKPLGTRVRFTGYLSQDAVAGAIRQADIAVLPSFAEGVPVFLMEAMASGKPVIATQIAGVNELAKDRESGLLIPPGDIDSLTEAIRTMANMSSEERSEMGAKGRAHVSANYNVATESARLARLFSGAADGVRPSPTSKPT